MRRAVSSRFLSCIIALLPVALAQTALGEAKGAPSSAAASGPAKSPYAAWRHGPSARPDFFPLAVWLQSPRNATKFKALGINTYVGLWEGPTDEQLAELGKCGMKVICSQNAVGLRHLDDPTIIGWMHGDEPDNAQDIGHWKSADAIAQAWPGAPRRTLAQWGKYGPPIAPKDIIADYQRIRQRDPARPVMLNLGQGVAYDNYIGRGYRRGKLEDYPQYVKGSDIVSFDIYPVVHDAREVAGRLEYVPRGVERLVAWSGGGKIVWNCIECTHISNPPAIASPQQIRSEVWMSIIHGSRGIIYFVHEFRPKFIEAGVLAHPEQAKAIERVNKQILELAAVINGPEPARSAKASSSDPEAPVAVMSRQHQGAVYVFAAAMRNKQITATFELPLPANDQIEVIGEGRSLPVREGRFQDEFKPYEVHLYRLPAPAQPGRRS